MHFIDLIMIGGLITLVLIIINVLIIIKIIKLDIKWYKILTFLTLIFAILHGLSAFLYVHGLISF